MTRNRWKEAFLSSNVKYILIACVVLIGQGVVGTAVSSGRRTFCSRFPRLTSAYIVGAALIGLAAERFTKNLWTDRTSGANGGVEPEAIGSGVRRTFVPK
jgi:hypothetical protein